MDEKQRRDYLEKYEKAKERGVPFFPDLLAKDALTALVVFLALVALAYFLGAPLEARADPADTTYTPRPEWYFLFLFQLLKYFPGSLEVIGVFVIPTIALLLLLALPFIDRRPQRHFRSRGAVIGITLLSVVGIVGLTIQAFLEAPPPSESVQGDQTAALYASNCAPCHGPSIQVIPGINLHNLIAQGRHEGMPAWSADLSTDQIDALAGFILSPSGSGVFTDECASCHEISDLVASDPLELKRAIEEGPSYAGHATVEVPEWGEVLPPENRTALLNFLVAPDGHRLFTINCASCHGRTVAFAGDNSDLRDLISHGGLHLEMPPWREKLSDEELATIAQFVVDPAASPNGEDIYQQYCADCHGDRIPRTEDIAIARELISEGGAHETMPVWGEILTSEQLDALVSYTLEATHGAPFELGQQLYAQNCAACHGDFGEGGPNLARPGDVIAPISSSEYLETRDDITLRAILAQGQPNFGMAPFGNAYGGPLDDDQIDAIVAFIRTWETNPPVEFPPEVVAETPVLSGEDVFLTLCAQCHGENGEGILGPSLQSTEFQDRNSDQEIFDTINLGHPATAMIAWGEILTSEQILELVTYIRRFSSLENGQDATPPSFKNDVIPIFERHCTTCHGTLGGWDASDYMAVMTSGDNAPVVIAGDPQGSFLGQKILGTQTQGAIMPPAGLMSEDEIQTILDWIEFGAKDN